MADLITHPATASRPAAIHAKAGREARERRLGWLLLGPTLAVLFAIAAYPLALAIKQSLSAQTGELVGLQNYARALQNPLLYEALGATGIYALLVLPAEIGLGLGLALLVHRTVRSTAVKAVVFVASTPDFTAQPKVANGASELLGEVFGDAGKHARSAVGVSVLPLDAAVEVELVVEV